MQEWVSDNALPLYSSRDLPYFRDTLQMLVIQVRAPRLCGQ